ncbi:MAG TPA: hypothetical protein P5556_03550 [Candidatus Gastranaerophilales bacterium]|nr:hypothetical protein [Candidatus Gastranaerophilales bacterium]
MAEERFSHETDIGYDEDIKPSMSGFWSEKVFVITEDYEIKGYVFMPKTGRKNRMLSDILNSSKRFVAIKDAEIRCRKSNEKISDSNSFIQLNLNSIILIKPCIKD